LLNDIDSNMEMEARIYDISAATATIGHYGTQLGNLIKGIGK